MVATKEMVDELLEQIRIAEEEYQVACQTFDSKTEEYLSNPNIPETQNKETELTDLYRQTLKQYAHLDELNKRLEAYSLIALPDKNSKEYQKLKAVAQPEHDIATKDSEVVKKYCEACNLRMTAFCSVENAVAGINEKKCYQVFVSIDDEIIPQGEYFCIDQAAKEGNRLSNLVYVGYRQK